MSTNRRTRAWPLKTEITPEALALFLELERRRKNPRTDPKFREKSRQLARMVGLLDEWVCSVCDVNDRSAGPCHPPEYVTHAAWFKVRRMRLALLAAAEEQRRQTMATAAAEEPEPAT